MSKPNICNNCGKYGHLYYQCKFPITSHGIIAASFDSALNTYKYLMIRRKNTFGYIGFMRGKYLPYNDSQIQELIDEMTDDEKREICTVDFVTLWTTMWGELPPYFNEEMSAQKKFEMIQHKIGPQFVANSTTNWCEPEWEFPKGRRNYPEKDYECALREFTEETGYPKNIVNIVENIIPFEEIFIGTDNKSYKYKYFLAIIAENDLKNTESNIQDSEVSKLEWKTIDQCLDYIRPYHVEKKQIIAQINQIFLQYQIL